MIKSSKNLFISFAVMLACACSAFADGNAFTPLNFDDVSYNPSAKKAAAPASTTTPAVRTTTSTNDLAGNTKMQNSILQLDNALVDIRNELLNNKAKYADVEARYQTVKAERKAVKKLVADNEKRIREIDRAKEKIRKNMI